MLKQFVALVLTAKTTPAAFRRLCVETNDDAGAQPAALPAAFRRLCVETIAFEDPPMTLVPAAFRRLCVETSGNKLNDSEVETSRL